ncbi:MAG: hypothetical protein Q9207_007974 [Kuettlingeria erythrocarpa]
MQTNRMISADFGGVRRKPDETSKPTAVYEPTGPRPYTVSVALPGSIIAHTLTPDLKTQLAGQIARALAVFCVDEVVVFDDGRSQQRQHDVFPIPVDRSDGFTGYSDANGFLRHLLSYLETPPFLRIHLFSIHPDLQLVGRLPSIDMPHHLRADEWCQYREGITLDEPSEAPARRKKRREDGTETEQPTLVDVGLLRKVSVPVTIPPKTRLTVKLPEDSRVPGFRGPRKATIAGSAVSPSEPREKAGFYWGYTVRAASSLSEVFIDCQYANGYDLTFGTSERGSPIQDLQKSTRGKKQVPRFKHMLVVFGGVAGLEDAVKNDTKLQEMKIKETKDLFDFWVNVCPGQGSRTIRTEEAVWLGLMGLREVVLTKGGK